MLTEKERDRLLRIDTMHSVESIRHTQHYHIYEATPYETLDKLFDQWEIQRNGTLVDFGCGKGRILFYVHHYFHIPVTGVEMDPFLYRRALMNESSYLQKYKKVKEPIRVVQQFAEAYPVEKEDTTFFFFNPFSIEIFKIVIQNIVTSIEEHPRVVELMLYYPSKAYRIFLEEETPFECVQEVVFDAAFDEDERERFMIYRHV